MTKLPQLKKKQTGKSGESLAATYLQHKGYRIIARNFRSRFGEIDLIATHNNRLIFVEVKARHSSLFGQPQEAVGKHKIAAITTTGELFISTHTRLPKQLQIDVIAIDMSCVPAKITHFENVTG